MDSVKNRTWLAEKRYRDKLKMDKKEIRLNTIKQRKRLEKLKKTITIIIITCKKRKRLQNYKRESNMN